MIPAAFVKGLISPGTQKILRSSHVFNHESSFDGLLVQCTLLKRPPEGGVHNSRVNMSSNYNLNYPLHQQPDSSVYYWATPDECDLIVKGGSRMLQKLLNEKSTVNDNTTGAEHFIPATTHKGGGGSSGGMVPHLTMITGIIRMSPFEAKQLITSTSSCTTQPPPPLRVTIQLSGAASAWVCTTKISQPISLHHTLCLPDKDKSGEEPNLLFGCCELTPRFIVDVNLKKNESSSKREAPAIAVSAHYPNISTSDMIEASSSSVLSYYSDRFVCGTTPGSIRKISSASAFPNHFVSDTRRNNTKLKALHMKLDIFLL